MTWLWFLLILVCYVAYTAKYLTYLLKSTEVIQIWEFDNLHMTHCGKIIVGFMENVGNVFYATFTDVFFIFPTFFTFFNVFLIFISTFITSMYKTFCVVCFLLSVDAAAAMVRCVSSFLCSVPVNQTPTPMQFCRRSTVKRTPMQWSISRSNQTS